MLENTESQEMYLTTIYALQKKNGMVRSVDVADERGYSKVSVHNAMKRLEEFGYVTFHQGKITLTKCGIEKVKNIEQKHQTIASALKLIGASNDIAEENACRMEHVIFVYRIFVRSISALYVVGAISDRRRMEYRDGRILCDCAEERR